MYKTNKKEIIEIIQQKRKEGSTQAEVAKFLTKNNYKWINKHGNLAGFTGILISTIERKHIKKNPTVKCKRIRINEDEQQIITNKIEEAINKTNVFLLPFLYSDNEKFAKRIKDVFDLDTSKNKDCSIFNLKSKDYFIQFITRYMEKYKPEFNAIKRIHPYDKKRKNGFKIYAKSLNDIEEFERKLKDNELALSLPLFEKSQEVEEVKQDKQLLALNLVLECDKLKSIDYHVLETEKEINELNARLEKLTQNVLQYNKLKEITQKQIEQINKELSNE